MGRVELKNLSKTFSPDIRAVENVDLVIEEGEFVTLLGPSGCGKTTSLRLIAGFEEPSSGQILINGQDVTAFPPYQRNTGMVFQSLALFPHMDVFGNIAYGMRIRRLSKIEICNKVDELLQLVRLQGMEKRKVEQLSGGQRQRVAFARALAMNPSVFLLDEPFAALDKNLREEMQIELRRLQKRIQITTIFVTHNQREAMSMSDRIVVMDQGRIQQVGSPREIYINPVSSFVANFIGTTNLIQASVQAVGQGEIQLMTSDGLVSVAGADVDMTEGQECIISIRPESVRLTVEIDKSRENAFLGKVSFKRHVGELIEYYINTRAGQEIIASYQTGRQEFFEGDTVQVILDREAYRLLSKDYR
ncbi:MAG: ABC transporter ATP-binding protein [Deltaproteobacteria bacterium]|nr:ABC transporter ATP-binding protein [Deltaproteobacteria bacterium]